MATKEYEEMKAQVLTAIAAAVTAEEIKTKDEIVFFRKVAGLQSEITIVGGGDNFSVDVLIDVEVPYYFKFTDLEEERERLLNKPEWPEDKQWQARAVDSDGHWFFYTKDIAERLEANAFEFIVDDGSQFRDWEYTDACCNPIAFPAGYDWKESLEFRPEKEEKEDKLLRSIIFAAIGGKKGYK